MRTAFDWLRTEPDVDKPPDRMWRDSLLAAAVAVAAIAEAAARGGIVWRALAVVLGLTLALTMLWRRTRPLAMVAVGFGAFLVADLTSFLAAGEPFSLYAGAAVLVLVYSLFRWGTTGQTAIGSAIALTEWLVSTKTDYTGVADAAWGMVALLFPAVLAVSIRYRRIVRIQQFDRIRFYEREMLARELHDTVAQHVSAIAVQAQAGQFLAKSSDLGGAARALEVIEKEASRTLTEMRSIVGSLRRDTGTMQTSPQRRLADIEQLAAAEGVNGLRVDVEYRGELEDVPPSVQAALYRVAQESITNARRHARHANRVHVVVAGDTDSARLSVIDNGERDSSNARPPGYGLVGMAERVALLGGTFEAGPSRGRGWTVHATIPRQGDPT